VLFAVEDQTDCCFAKLERDRIDQDTVSGDILGSYEGGDAQANNDG
jgi:hypothetical protein